MSERPADCRSVAEVGTEYAESGSSQDDDNVFGSSIQQPAGGVASSQSEGSSDLGPITVPHSP